VGTNQTKAAVKGGFFAFSRLEIGLLELFQLLLMLMHLATECIRELSITNDATNPKDHVKAGLLVALVLPA
jgi:hypothetical protein